MRAHIHTHTNPTKQNRIPQFSALPAPQTKKRGRERKGEEQKKSHFYSFNLLNHVIFSKNILTGCSRYYDYDYNDDGYYLDVVKCVIGLWNGGMWL